MLLDERKPEEFSFGDDLDNMEDLPKRPSDSKTLRELEKELHSLSDDGEDENDEHRTILQELLGYVKILIIAVILALLINNFVIINASVPTGSMIHTIMKGDRLVGFRLAYIFSQPKRGDVIIFKYPDDPTQKFVKRVIGLPGDVVEIKRENGSVNVYVNGSLLSEPYLHEAMYSNKDYTFIVPADSYFVMGDNRNDSKDSRYWVNTYVPKNYILAKAIFKYYSEFAFFERPVYE